MGWNKVSNSSIGRPWTLEENTSGQASRASSLWKLGQNNMTKKGPFFWSSKRNKKQAHKKWASPVQNCSRSCYWWNQLQLGINVLIDLSQWRGQNWTLQGGSFLISRGPLSEPFLKYISFARGSKTGPSTNWIRCLLGGRVLSPPKYLLQLHETHQRHTTNQHHIRNKDLEQGRPQLRLQKLYQFQVPKNEPITSLMHLLVLIITIFPFLLCWWKVAKAYNRGASRLGKAWPRPRLGRKIYRHKDKVRLTGTRNYIILLLKFQQGWT